MPIFAYTGLDRSGKEVKGTVNTDSVVNAKAKIKSQGIMLVGIKEQKSGGKGGSLLSAFFSGVSVSDLALMTRQLATLIKAKIQIVEALGALVDQVDNQTLRVILSETKQRVNEGQSLARALAEHPKVFDHVYVNMVEAGEASGNLDVVLLRLADFTEAQVKLANRIKGAMTYPLIMMLFGVVMMTVIFMFVIPKITKIFVAMKKELPIQTQISIWVSNFLLEYWWLVFFGGGAGVWLFLKYIRGPGQRRWHTLTLRFPIFGKITTMVNIGRFCSTLATLLNSGVPIIAAMTIVKNLVPNLVLKDAIEDAKISVSEGKSLAAPLAASGQFPSMMTHMIALGEKSGELEDMLKIVAENYEEQVDAKLSGLTSILEPIMMIGLGIAVGFIVFSVVIPMMSLNEVR